MKRTLLLILMIFLMTACGSSLINENFESSREIPASLTPVDTVLGVSDEDGYLRIVNIELGRNQSGLVQLDAQGQNDYSLETRVRVTEGIGQLWVRADAEECQGYALVIDPTRNSYRLSQVDENCDLRTVDDVTRLQLNFDTWIDARIEVRGNRIRGFIDGAPLFDIEDDTYTTGQPLIRVVNENPQPAVIELDTLRLR